MEFEPGRRSGGDGSLQVKSSRSVLGTNAGSFLTFAVLFIVIFQVYNKGSGKRSKKNTEDGDIKEEEYLGIDDLPKLKNSIPFLNVLGPIPRYLPFSRTLKQGEKEFCELGDLFYIEAFFQKFVVFNGGPQLQALLKSADFGHLKKVPILYEPFKRFVSTAVLVSERVFWQKQRKILLKSQSYQNLRAYMGMLNRHGQQFVDHLEKKFEDGNSHTINEMINTHFLAVISEMITGKNMDRSSELREYHHSFIIWKDTVVRRVFNPLLLLKPIWYLHPRSKIHGKAEDFLFDFAKARLEEHKEKRAAISNGKEESSSGNTTTDKEKPSFRCVLDELLDSGMDDEQMIQEINVMMFGGHETGASTLHCFLYALAADPKIQEQARKEVDELYETPINLKNGNITYEAVQTSLKYVERCFMETLRLFPPIFINGRKLETSLKVEYKDKTVLLPAGTNIIILPIMLQRREEYFPEPHKFDPDRFLPDEVANRHAYSFIPFSAGPRNCLGLKFAMIELKTMIAYILRYFEMTTTDKFEDIVFMPYTTLTPQKDFSFQFKKRCF